MKIKVPWLRLGWRGLLWASNGFVAGPPNHKKGSLPCRTCGGRGWDADWGGPYVCTNCEGTGQRVI